MTRYTVHFTGHVQGVGFRLTTCNVARDFLVAGTVRNLSDGRVELIAEGAPDQVKGLVDAVKDRMNDHIQKATVDESPATGEFGEPVFGGVRVAY